MTPLAKTNGFLRHMQVYNPALTPNGSIRAGRNLFTTEVLVLFPSGRRLRGLLLSTLRVEAQKIIYQEKRQFRSRQSLTA